MKWARTFVVAVLIVLTVGSGMVYAQPLHSLVSLTSSTPGNVTFIGFPPSNILLASQANRRFRLTFLNVWLESDSNASPNLTLWSFRLREVGYGAPGTSAERIPWVPLVSVATVNSTRTEYRLPLANNPGTQLPLHYFETRTDAAVAIDFGGLSARWSAIAGGYYLAP